MSKELHPSDSTEQQLAHTEILTLMDGKYPLNLDEIQTHYKIVTALSKTIQLQKEIDENYEGVEK